MTDQKKVVLVTGCSTGIGRALAEEFLKKDFIVYATARKIKTLAELKVKGIFIKTLDITVEKNVADVVGQIISEQGRIDILVNNAGYAAIGPIAEMPMEELKQEFETNVLAQVNLIQRIVPHMQRQKSGLIVNIGSVSGILTTPFAGAYCATKSALHSISDALRMELAPFGIKVITVQPGAVKSNLGNRSDSDVGKHVSADSAYAPILDAIHQRAQTSQENPMSAEEFAAKLVKILNKKNPKIIIRLGKGGHFLPFLKRLLPESMLDKILSKKFKLNKLVKN